MKHRYVTPYGVLQSIPVSRFDNLQKKREVLDFVIAKCLGRAGHGDKINFVQIDGTNESELKGESKLIL